AITFQQLLGRFDLIELRGEAKFQDRLTLRGLTALHIACRAATARQPSAPLPEVAPPAATPSLPASSAERGLRPGGADADVRWPADLRQRIESAPTRADSIQVRTGDRLAATVALLARNRLFQRCSRVQLEHLAATAYPMSFEPGDMLCVEGAESPECYVV